MPRVNTRNRHSYRDVGAAYHTRQKMIAAALRLFAARGVENVTSRQILMKAGQRNQSGLQYHFGGKRGLLLAVLSFVREQFDPFLRQTAAELDALQRQNLLTPRDVVSALLTPIIDLYHQNPSGRDAIWLLMRFLTEGSDWGHIAVMKEWGAFLADIESRLAILLPHKSREKLQLQIMLVVGSQMFGLVALRALKHSPFGNGAPLYEGRFSESIDHAIDLNCVGLIGDS